MKWQMLTARNQMQIFGRTRQIKKGVNPELIKRHCKVLVSDFIFGIKTSDEDKPNLPHIRQIIYNRPIRLSTTVAASNAVYSLFHH